MADADDTENSGDSDATEGEDEDTEGDNETPVIENENNTGEETGENTDENEAESPAETPVEPDPGASIMSVDDISPMVVTDHKVTYTESDDYTVAFTAGVAADNTITADAATNGIAFTVTPAAGKTIQSVNWQVGESGSPNELEGTETEGSDAKTYTIANSVLTDEAITDNIILTVTVQPKTYTVTVTKGANGVKTATYTDDGTSPTASSTTLGASIASVEHGKNIKLYVEAGTGYSITVKKGNETVDAVGNVYDLGTITGDTEIAIDAEKTSYEVKSNVAAASGETIDEATLNAVKVVWGAEVIESGVDTKTYTILKDTDLTFTIDGLGDLKAAVFYGGDSSQTTPVELKGGKYTVPQAAIKENDGITIKVEVRNAGKSTITMAENADVKELTYKDASGAYKKLEASGVEITEDQNFTFKVAANEFFKVTDVTAKTASNKKVDVAEATEGEDTVYSFTATNENITITVETELDAEQCYQLDMVVDGDEGSVTAAVTVADDAEEADTPALNKTLPADEALVTRNAKVKVVLTVDSHYELAATEPVKLGTTALTTETPNTYTLDLTKGALATLTVKTERKALENANTVTFDASGVSHLELAVTEVPDKVTQDSENENKYNLAVGVKDVDFTLTANGPYTPTVKYSTTKEVKPTGTPVKGEDGKTTYSYSLAAALLAENDTIVIEETESKKKITVLYDDSDVDVSMKMGAVPATSSEIDGGVEVEVTEGDSLTVTASALDNCKLDEITKKVGSDEAATLEGFTKGAAFHKFIVTAEDDVTITITAKKELSVQPLKDVENNVTLTLNKSKKYEVRYDGTYEATVKSGTALLPLQKVEMKQGNAVVPQTKEDGTKNWSTTFSAGDTGAQIKLAEGLAGADCTLLLYDSAEDGAQPVATYALKVSALLADKDVKINTGKEIKQVIDTTASYKVAVTNGADVNELKFEIPTGDANKDVVKAAEIKDGMLHVTTGFGAGESTELKVYTGSENNKKYIQKDGKDLTVKVTAELLLNKEKTAAPTVKQASSTDVSITLALGAKNIAKPASGKVYYEVKLTPNYVEADHKDKLLPTVPVQYIERTGDAQEAAIYVGAKGDAENPVYGSGAACQYGVAVRLVHSTEELANGTDITTAQLKGESKPFAKDAGKDFATKNPTYESGLKLKKGTANVYTTQGDVVIATPTFNKDTSYNILPNDGASDITKGLNANETLTVWVEDNKVMASADENTALGKHTIQVLATSTDPSDTENSTMYASRATIVVTVVRGIEGIELTVPTTSIFYADKAVNLKTAVAYNTDRNDTNPKDSVPKTKKAEYKLVDASVTKASLDTLEKLNNAQEAAVVKDGIKIDKSGKITVPKNYKVTADSTFKVLVKAADFAENTKIDLSEPITITRDYMQIAKATIVKHNEETAEYDVIDADGKELQASELNGAQMIAFEAGVPNKTSYTDDDLKTYQITENLTYTSGNKKAVEIDTDGTIKVNTPAKNVKLTVAPADGSAADKKLNTTKTITTTIKYDDVSELGLEIVKVNLAGGDNTPPKNYSADEVEEAGGITYSDSSAAAFRLSIKNRNTTEGTWEAAPEFTEYKLAVSKGKKLLDLNFSEGGELGALIAATDKETTVKLTYKVYNESKKKYESNTKDYKLTNEGLAAVVDAKTKAPKVVFRNKRSTIQENYTTADKSLDRWYNESKQEWEYSSRYIGFNLQPNGNGYPLDFNEAKDAEGNDLYVKVDVDWSAMTAKNKDMLKEFADSMTPQGYQKLNSNGNYGGYVQLDFADNHLTPGSYKLKVSVGTINDNRDFVPAAQPAAITVKVAKDKALSFKPTTSYKISAKDNGYAVLTGKGSYDYVEFSNLQNDNVKGKAKGKENAFTEYFELAKDNQGNQILKLKDSCFADGKLADIPPEDLTGYVSYEAGYEYSKNYDTVKGAVKLTVKLEGNTINKYTISNATADKSANAVANVNVTLNKKAPVTVAYALVKEADKGTWQVVAKNGEAWAPAITVNSSVISLQHTDAMTDKSAKVTLLVIPEDSYYKAKIDAVTDDADNTKKKAIITQYGVELKTTVTLNDLSDGKTNKRVTVANTAQKFTAQYDERNGAESGYDATNDNYWINVPYTELYDNATAQIIGIETVDAKYKDLISFNKETLDDGTKAFSISMNKNTFMAKVAEKETDYYTVKTTKDGYKNYTSKVLTVNAKVCYGGTAEAPADPSDKISFKLTMPAYPKVTASEGVTDFEAAIAMIKELASEISDSIAENMQRYNYYYMQELSGDELDESVKGHVTMHLEDHIRWYVSDDSGIDMREIQKQMTVDTSSYKAPTAIAEGLVKVTVKFNNGKADTAKKEEDIVFTVNLPAFGATASDVQTVVEAFLNQADITNKTTRASLLAELKAYVKENADYDTSKIRYTISKFTPKKASLGVEGSLEVVINIYDLAGGGDPVTVDKTGDNKLTIPALLDANTVVTNVKKAVGVEAPDGSTTAAVIKELAKTNNEAKTKKAVEEAAKAAIGSNPYVVAFAKKTDSEDDDFTFKPATANEAGSLSFKLVVKNDNGTALDGTAGDVELTNGEVPAIAGLLTLTEAEKRVQAWITANTLAETDDASSDTKLLKNGVTADAIVNAIKNDTTNGVSEASLITVTMKAGFACEDATVNKAGGVKGKLVLTDMADATKEVTISVGIPKLPQTETQAVEIIKTAVEEAVKAGTITVTKDTQNEDATVTDAILAAAEGAAGLKEGAFMITVKDSAKLTITAPSGSTAGKATITLVVTAKTSGTGTDCEIVIEIPADEAPVEP